MLRSLPPLMCWIHWCDHHGCLFRYFRALCAIFWHPALCWPTNGLQPIVCGYVYVLFPYQNSKAQFQYFGKLKKKKMHAMLWNFSKTLLQKSSIFFPVLSDASDANDSHIRVSVTFWSANVDNLSLRNGIWVSSKGKMFIPSFLKFWLESLNGRHISKENTHIAWWFQRPALSVLRWDVGKEIHRVLVFFMCMSVCIYTVYIAYLRLAQ